MLYGILTFLTLAYHKDKILTMRSILPLFTILLLAAGAQAQHIPYQIKAGLSNYGTVSGDTAYFQIPGEKSSNNLARFFNKNLRMPQSNGPDGLETGSCTLHFVLDTTGTIVHSWCEQISNEMIAKEVLRVAQKLGKMTPSSIGGRSVRTEIEMSFKFYVEGGTIPVSTQTRADIVVVGYPAVRKQAISK